MKYSPHEYQRYATEYIETHPVAAVLLSMGLGKTSITLTALNDLLFDRLDVYKRQDCPSLWKAQVQRWDWRSRS